MSDNDWLVGGTITSVHQGSIGETIAIKLKEQVLIDDKPVGYVEVEVWRDEEGNGPGYLALTRVKAR